MRYFTILFMFCAGYYCLTYGISLWKAEKNKLGGFGVILAAMMGTIVPVIYILIKK